MTAFWLSIDYQTWKLPQNGLIKHKMWKGDYNHHNIFNDREQNKDYEAALLSLAQHKNL